MSREPRRAPGAGSPRDRFVTVYGRVPVLEVLGDARLEVDKVVLADNARGEAAATILAAARRRSVRVERTGAQRVKLLAGNGKHDQGVIADVVAPRMAPLATLVRPTPASVVLLLDGITNPANVGMILRSATAAGLDGIVVPHRGSPPIDPLVVKASAGVAYRAPILRCATAVEGAAALVDLGYLLVGLAADAPAVLWDAPLGGATALVLGNERDGVSAGVAALVGSWVGVPMANGVESLNVASAAAVTCFELARRRASAPR